MAEVFEKTFLDLGSFNTLPDLAAQAFFPSFLFFFSSSLILNPLLSKSWASVMVGQGLASPRVAMTSGKWSKSFVPLATQIPQLLKD